MLPSTICLRCRSRLLQRQLQSSTSHARDFVSLRQNNTSSEVEQIQDDIIPSKQAKSQSQRKPRWSPPRSEESHVKNMEDPLKGLLDSLFDSSRHEAPKSSVYRYSRRPIEQPPPQKSQTSSTIASDFSIQIQSAKSPTSYARSSRRVGHNTQGARSNKSENISLPTTDTTNILPMKHQSSSMGKESTSSKASKLPSQKHGGVHKFTIRKSGSSTFTTINPELDAESIQGMPDTHSNDIRAESPMSLTTDGIAERETELEEATTIKISRPRPGQAQKDDLNFERLRTRILHGDIRSNNELWHRFHKLSLQTQFKETELATLFADFLWAFAKLRKMEPLMEVWSSMSEGGIKPSIRHWNAILRVLQRNRDVQRFRAIWQAMLDGGTRPDRESWTIHLELLLAQFSHDWRAAIRLLDTMGKFWREAQAEQATSNIQPEHLPSIEPINAAITGLLRLHLTDVASDVFKWARSFPVQVDTTSYNIFLRYACENGQNASVSSILKEMERNNIKQDVVTKTIMLDNILRNTSSGFHTLSLSEQERLVVEKLNQMTNEGTPPNDQTFAVALHALLHLSTPNLPAAQAVFQMTRQIGHKVSPQIYTIFLTHHFNSKTPNLHAVESTWNEIKRQGTKIDHVLYDRMIEGYAAVGELEKMLGLFREMTAAGQSAGWLALKKALAALVRASAWNLCAELVADVTHEDGYLHVGKRGWKGEREFWLLVADLQEQKLIPVRKKAG